MDEFAAPQLFVAGGTAGELLGGEETDPALQVDSKYVKERFSEFIKSFERNARGFTAEVPVYREELFRLRTHVRVDVTDLESWDNTLTEALGQQPSAYLPLFEEAAAEVLQASRVLADDGSEPERPDVQVILTSSRQVGPASMRGLTSKHVSSLVMIRGIVTAAYRPTSKATHLTIQCRGCQAKRQLLCQRGMDGTIIPRTCDAGGEGTNCGLDPFVILPHQSVYADTQKLKLQELPEDVPTGELPRSMPLVCERKLVDRVVPGTRVTVLGILSVQSEGAKMKGKGRGGKDVAVRQPYIRVVGIETDSGDGTDSEQRSTPQFTQEEEAAFREFAAQPGAKERILGMIAPQIFGSDDIKKAIACLLFGGSRKVLQDGVGLRGDINVLLLGDPSTAKSQFLKFVSKTAPVAVYTSGKGSSAAGLTATVVRDANTREFYLEGGAMVLADGGVVCIDEFDKMREEDRVAIHEAMEQQTISVAKAGITTVLNSRAAVLAAANPPSGRYDDLKSAQDNIDLQTTILSRFDLIFIVKDDRTFERDLRIARHVLGVHGHAGGAGRSPVEEAAQQEEAEFLRRYIQFAKSRIHSRLSDDAMGVLTGKYVHYRAEFQAARARKEDCVPITVRQLEAMIRIAESLARMTLRETATAADVEEAVALFEVATMDAAKSGMARDVHVSEEDREQLRGIEGQIKRRIAVGARVPERRLVDDMKRAGFAEGLVRRALMVMVNRKDLDYLQERRMLKRLR
ncbi:unnamed protein product [Pedinophyceae sp. YPF-701]|nr:unnamed protein product [Pedinophyceae sp. YPF-701]